MGRKYYQGIILCSPFFFLLVDSFLGSALASVFWAVVGVAVLASEACASPAAESPEGGVPALEEFSAAAGAIVALVALADAGLSEGEGLFVPPAESGGAEFPGVACSVAVMLVVPVGTITAGGDAPAVPSPVEAVAVTVLLAPGRRISPGAKVSLGGVKFGLPL